MLSRTTVPVKARSRESMELDAAESPTRPHSKTRQKVRAKLSSVSEEIVLVSEHDPRRED